MRKKQGVEIMNGRNFRLFSNEVTSTAPLPALFSAYLLYGRLTVLIKLLARVAKPPASKSPSPH